MKTALFFLFLVICLSLSNDTFATRYWVAATTSNWNNTSNWSSTSGGIGGSTVPGTTDDVVFDNNGLGSCNIDAAVNIKSLSVVIGYSGTISQGTNPIGILNTASFGAGIFSGGSANITITGAFTLSGTNFTSTSAILELRDNAAFTSGTFTHNSGTVRMNCTNTTTQTISGNAPSFFVLEFVGIGRTYTISTTGNLTVLNSLTLSGSLFYNLAIGAIDVKGDINISNAATGCGGDALININGTGTQNYNGGAASGQGALPQLTINKPSGTLNLANFPSVSNNFTYTAGTVNAGTSTFCFTHGSVGSYTATGTLSLNNIEFNVNSSGLTATIASGTTLTATGNLNLSGTGNTIINTGAINVNGNIVLTNTATAGGGSATINLVGLAAQSIDGTAVTGGQSRLPVININKSTGTLSLLGNVSFSANLTYTAGTINAGTSTAYFVNNLTVTGNFTLFNLTISTTGTVTISIATGNTLTVAGDYTMLTGTANNININTGTLAVQGNIIDNNTGTSGGGTGTLLINGTGAQAITSTGVIYQGTLPAVTINKVSGTLTLPSLITERNNWTYIAGTLDVSTNNSTVVFGNTLTITGNHTLNNIVFDGGGNYTITIAAGTTLSVNGNMGISGASNITLNTGTINLSGNLNLTNTATNGGGNATLNFAGTGSQAITSTLAIYQSSLPAITINKTLGTLTFPALITVRGNWTYIAGTLDVATNNSTVVFNNNISFAGSHSLNNVNLEGNLNNTYTFNTGTILTVTGTLTTSGSFNVNISTPVNGATAIQAQGNITINNTATNGGGNGTILINGSGAQTLTSTAAAGQGRLPAINIQKPSGLLTLAGIISESQSWTWTSGTVDAGTNTSTVVFGGNNLSLASAGMSFYNLSFSANTSSLTNNLSVSNNLTIGGAAVLAPGANSISLAGNWSNWGSAGFTESTSTVNFTGSGLQSVTSPGGENFSYLVINNTGAGIQLANNVTVATNLTMTQGNIDLNGGQTLTLGLSVANNGTLAYTAGAILNTGSFTRWLKAATIPAASVNGLFPMGTATTSKLFYLSAPVTAPTTGGTLTIAYNQAAGSTAVSFLDGGSTVAVIDNLNWVSSTGNGLAGGTYNLEVQGTGFGVVGNTADLRMTLAAGVVGVAGANAGTTSNPQINRTGLTLANLSNTFFVGSINTASSPLPITLVSFSATVVNRQVDLTWETSSEINNDFFTVQRSKDGTKWDNIQQIPGSRNSNGNSTYTATDQAPYSGVSYYRIQQTDLDGKQSYSALCAVRIQTMSPDITVFPNPAATSISIAFPTAGKYEVKLLNSAGQLMKSSISASGNSMLINTSNLDAGIYFISILHDNILETRIVTIRR